MKPESICSPQPISTTVSGLGLGVEFAVDVGLALARVLEAPQRWPEIDNGIRRYRLDRFPYALIYRTPAPQTIDIIAEFNLRRRPGSWRT